MNDREKVIFIGDFFFDKMCGVVVCDLASNYVNVESFGNRFYLSPKNRTLVSSEFFIRFTDGITVMLVWDYACNALNVSIAYDGGSEADFAFDVPFKNTIFSAMDQAISWNEGTWGGELRDVILKILNHAKAGKLAELFSRSGGL